MKLGDLSIDVYFRKIESIATILTSLGSLINNDDVFTIALEGLPDKYENISDIITHPEPFPDLKTTHFMLTAEEMRLKSRAQAASIDYTSSLPMVLLANSDTSSRHYNVATNKSIGFSYAIAGPIFDISASPAVIYSGPVLLPAGLVSQFALVSPIFILDESASHSGLADESSNIITNTIRHTPLTTTVPLATQATSEFQHNPTPPIVGLFVIDAVVVILQQEFLQLPRQST
nr:hybrid signal transduction histidine kinase M [Tanacetum cinerariifolium]